MAAFDAISGDPHVIRGCGPRKVDLAARARAGYADLAFAYNAAGRLTTVSGSSGSGAYIYNALGQRIRKSTGSSVTYFTYDEAGHLIGEYDGQGSLVQEIVWLGDTPIASLRLEACGFAMFYIHSDHLNTPRRITRRSSADVVWSWESGPFGDATPDENPSGLGVFSFNLRFSGQYYDVETGLNYNYLRDYDPATGRYVESDPIGLDAGPNTYAYTNSNPIGNTVPDGTGPAGAAIGGAIGGWLGGLAGAETGPADAPAVAAGRAIGRAVGSAIEDEYDREWRTTKERWKIYTHCNVQAFNDGSSGAKCDGGCPPPKTIGGWGYGRTFSEAFANA